MIRLSKTDWRSVLVLSICTLCLMNCVSTLVVFEHDAGEGYRCTNTAGDKLLTPSGNCGLAPGSPTTANDWVTYATTHTMTYHGASLSTAMLPEGTGIDLIYETAKGTCFHGTFATAVYNIKFQAAGDVCLDTGGPTEKVITSTNSLRAGPPNWIFTPVEVDFSGAAPSCKLGILGQAPVAGHNDALLYTETASVLSDGSPVNTGMCEGKTTTFTYADATVSNVQRVVVDLNKFICYVPWDCTTRRLEIDNSRWAKWVDEPEKRKTDQHLYHCVMQTTYQEGLIKDDLIAQDYLLIGSPDHIFIDSGKMKSGFTLNYTTKTCTANDLGNNLKTYFWDVNTGLCRRYKDDGSVDAFHIYGQDYSFADLTIAHTDIGANKFYFDVYNGKCLEGGAAAVEQAFGQATYKFNIADQLWEYQCTYLGTKTSVQASAGHAIIGFQTQTWSCDNENIDLKYRKDGSGSCYKGEQEYDFNNSQFQCGGIPLMIHRFDVISWVDETKIAVDVINQVCKYKMTGSNGQSMTMTSRLIHYETGGAIQGAIGTSDVLCSHTTTAIPNANIEWVGGQFIPTTTELATGKVDFAQNICGDEAGANIGTLVRTWGFCIERDIGIRALFSSYKLITITDLDTSGTQNPAADVFATLPLFYIESGAPTTINHTGDIALRISILSEYSVEAHDGTNFFNKDVGATEQIGYKRFWKTNYYDDKIRVDLSSAMCYYKGITMTLKNDERKCQFQATPYLFKNINVGSYELIKTQTVFNVPTDYIVDFYSGQCWEKGFIQPRWIKTLDTANLDMTASPQAADHITCSGQKKDGTGLLATSLNTKTVKFFGKPKLADAAETNTYHVDFVNNYCFKKTSAGTQINGPDGALLTSTLDLINQACVDFYYPLTYGNPFRVENAYTYLKDFTKNTMKYNAILDVKNSQCWVMDYINHCALTRAANTAGDDMINTCVCNEVVDGVTESTTYEFSEVNEFEINFIYVGYHFLNLKYSDIVATREIPLFNVYSASITANGIFYLSAANNVCSVGGTAGTWDTVNFKCTVGGVDYPMNTINYKFDFSEWHRFASNLWVIDFIQSKCYKKGDANEYDLKVTGSGTYDCTSPAATVASTAVTDSLVLGGVAADANMIWKWATGTCQNGGTAFANQYTVDPTTAQCHVTGNTYTKPQAKVTAGVVDAAVYINVATIGAYMLGFKASTVVDFDNNYQCFYRDSAGAFFNCGSATTITDISIDCTCAGAAESPSMNINDDFLYGTDLYIIGYDRYDRAATANNYYYLDLANDKCWYYSYEFSFDNAQFICTDTATPAVYSTDVDLRKEAYKIGDYGTYMAIADYHYGKCHTPSGNDYELYFTANDPATAGTDETVKECRRLTRYGWDILKVTYIGHVKEIGENATSFGKGNLAFFINMSNLGCWKDVVDTGTSIGTFDVASGICNASGVANAYIKYQKPTYSNLSSFSADASNTGIELYYFVQEGTDMCYTSTEADSSLCTPSIYYDQTLAFGKVAIKCACTGQTDLIKYQEDIGVTVRLVGGFASRFLDTSFYNHIEIDLDKRQCNTGTTTLMNYNELTKSCYYRTTRQYIYRQFYDVKNWTGKSTGAYLVDHFRALCFQKDDCTPMKYIRTKTYPEDTDNNAATADVNVNYAFCNRIVDADVGFMTRTSSYSEFGTEISAALAINVASLSCAANSYFDPELVSCIHSTTESLDTSQQQMITIGGTNELVEFYKSDALFKWNENLSPQYLKNVAIPSINMCIMHECDDSNNDNVCDNIASTGRLCTDTNTDDICDAQIVRTGFLSYELDNSGFPAWRCTGRGNAAATSKTYTDSFAQATMEESKTLFVGGKVIGNHCKNYANIFGALTVEEKQKYFIHIDLENSRCYMLYDKPNSSVWNFDKDYVPAVWVSDYLPVLTGNTHTDTYGSGTFVHSTYIDQNGSIQATKPDQICSNTVIRQYQYSLQYEDLTKKIYDWVQQTCYTSDGARLKKNILQAKEGGYYCDYDAETSTAFLENAGRASDGGGTQVIIEKNNPSVRLALINLDTMTCSYGDAGTDTPLRYFDPYLQLCDEYIDVSSTKKQLTFPINSPVTAFIDLGRKTCYFENMRGHLVEFDYKADRFFQPNRNEGVGIAQHETLLDACMLSGADATTCDPINEARKQDVDIKCRFYDQNAATGVNPYSLKEFTLNQVMISGLDEYFSATNKGFTSNLDLYLIRPKSDLLSDQPVYECILVSDNSNMYDPNVAYTGTIPSATDSGWQVYTANNHKCGSTPLQDYYYKVITGDWTQTIEFAVDTWGARCFRKDGTILELQYDQFAKPNVCIEKFNDDEVHYYISYNFKQYDLGKSSKYASVVFPFLKNQVQTAALTIADTTGFPCAAGYETTVGGGYCVETATQENVNICQWEYTFAANFHTNIRAETGTEGIIDLCQKKCYLSGGGVTMTTGWDLTEINEFKAVCKDPTNPATAPVTRYNEQYTLFGDRGTYFSLKTTNEFQVVEVTVDFSAATCSILRKGVTTAGFTLVYKDDHDRIIQNWFCRKIETDNSCTLYYLNTAINHFKFTNLGTFLDPKNRLGDDPEKELRQKMIVDVYNGWCFNPADANLSFTDNTAGAAMDFVANADLQQTLKKLDDFNKSDLNSVITCNGEDFFVKDTYFIGYQNVISTDCPNGMYKNADTGMCQLCLYECGRCTSPNTCDACIVGYEQCITRCFDTAANGVTWAQSASGLRVWGTGTTCTECPDYCKDCSDSTTCTKCEEGTLLYTANSNTFCIPVFECWELEGRFVPTGTLTETSVCGTCATGCRDCAGDTNSCTECDSTRKLDTKNHTCETTCQAGTYESGAYCLPCDISCGGCDGPRATECIKPGGSEACNEAAGYYPTSTTADANSHFTCTKVCPVGQYVLNDGDDNTPWCQDCHTECGACVTTSTTCTKCKEDNAYLSPSNECVVQCPAKYFEFTNFQSIVANNASQGPWHPCTAAEWDRMVQYGQQTYQEYEIKNFKLVNGDVRPFCYPCATPCGTCFGPFENQCTTCDHDNNYYEYRETSSSTLQCLNDYCPYGYFKGLNSDSKKTCKKCSDEIDNCLECTDDSTCTLCGPSLVPGQTTPVNYLTLLKTCSMNCESTQFKNEFLRACQNCDSSQCTTCSEYDNKCLSCTSVSGKPYLDTRTSSCVASCPSGTTLSNNQCLVCGTTGAPACTACPANCLNCYGASNEFCSVCAAGYLLNEDSNTCHLVSTCTALNSESSQKYFRASPADPSVCQLCPANCTKCGEWGCETCADNFVRKGWPYWYCVAETANNDCQNRWFETEENECDQCSNYCSQCTTHRYNCHDDTGTSTCQLPGATAAQKYYFDDDVTGLVCFCDFSVSAVVNQDYTTLTISIPKDTNIKWNYVTSNIASILNDKTAKTKKELDAQAKALFNTSNLSRDSVSPQFKTYFNSFNRASNADIERANQIEEQRIRGLDATYSGLSNQSCLDDEKGFGEEHYGYDLLQILFEYQNWSKMGEYEYITRLNGVNKEIEVTLGPDHEFDLLRNPLIVRDQIIDYKNCVNPIRRWWPQTTAPALLTPIVQIQHTFSPVNNIPLCSPFEVRAQIFNYPKNIASQYKWTMVELNRPTGDDDRKERQAIQEEFDELPPLTDKYLFSRERLGRLIGYRARIRVEAVAPFSQVVPNDEIEVIFLATGDFQLSYLNQQTYDILIKGEDSFSFPLEVEVPSCLLTNPSTGVVTTSKSYLSSRVTFAATTYDCTDATEVVVSTLEFDQSQLVVKYPKDMITANDRVCVKVTATDSTTGVAPSIFRYIAFPEFRTPVITTNVGNEFQVAQAAVGDSSTTVNIKVNVDYVTGDTANPLAMDFECKTITGNSCFIVAVGVTPVPFTATWDSVSSDGTTTIRIPLYQMTKDQIYEFTLIGRQYNKSGSTKVRVNVVTRGTNVLSGTWLIEGIYNGYARGDQPAFFNFIPSVASSAELGVQSYNWELQLQDDSGTWNVFDYNGKEGFSAGENSFSIEKVNPERLQRLTLTATVNGISGLFVIDINSKSGINVEFAVTPDAGSSSKPYNFQITNKGTPEQQYLYTWIARKDVKTDEGTKKERQIIRSESRVETFEDYITLSGDESEDFKIKVDLIVIDRHTRAQRLYEVVIVNKKGFFQSTILGESLIPSTKLNVVKGLSFQDQQTKDQVISVVNASIEVFNHYIGIKGGYLQADSGLASAIRVLHTNSHVVSEIDLTLIDSVYKNLREADSDVKAIVDSTTYDQDFTSSSIQVINEITFLSQFDQASSIQTLFNTLSNNDSTSVSVEKAREILGVIRLFSKVKYAQYAPQIVPGTTYSYKKNGFSTRIKALKRADGNAQSDTTAPVDTPARYLQEEETTEADAATTTEDVTLAFTEGQPIVQCNHSYILGEQTLESVENHHVSMTVIDNQIASSLYKYNEDQDATTDVPLCELVEIEFMKSVPNGVGTSNIVLYNKLALTEFQQYTVCFHASAEVEYDTELRFWNLETKLWEVDATGSIDEEQQNIEQNKFCRKVSRTGIIGLFYESNSNPERLYAGFIIYVIVLVDLFLLLGVILGMKLDKQKKSPSTTPRLSKAQPADGTDTKIAFGDKEEQDKLANGGEEAEKQIRTGTTNATKPLKFGGVLCVYHRCLNVYGSDYHIVPRALRVFSFCLQLIFLINFLGLITYGLDVQDSAGDVAIAYVITFIILRIANFFFTWSLENAEAKKGGLKIVTLVFLIILYVLGHYAPIHVTLVMIDTDFVAWTVAFFVCFILDVVLWDLLVTAFQFVSIKQLRQSKKPAGEKLVSPALKKAYI